MPQKNFAIVIPQEGPPAGAPPILILVLHQIYNIICEGLRLQIYCRCHTKRRIGMPDRQSFFWYDDDKNHKRCIFAAHASYIMPTTFLYTACSVEEKLNLQPTRFV